MKKYLKNDNAVRIMRMSEVIKAAGYSRASIYKFMAEGSFPKSKKLGLRAVGWNSQEIQAWVNEKLAGEDANG